MGKMKIIAAVLAASLTGLASCGKPTGEALSPSSESAGPDATNVYIIAIARKPYLNSDHSNVVNYASGSSLVA